MLAEVLSQDAVVAFDQAVRRPALGMQLRVHQKSGSSVRIKAARSNYLGRTRDGLNHMQSHFLLQSRRERIQVSDMGLSALRRRLEAHLRPEGAKFLCIDGKRLQAAPVVRETCPTR